MTTATLSPARKLLMNLALLATPGIGLAVPNEGESAQQNPHQTPEAPADAVDVSTAVEALAAPVEPIEAPAEYAEVFESPAESLRARLVHQPSPAEALRARLVHKVDNNEAMDAEETKEFLKFLDDQRHAEALKHFNDQGQAADAARRQYWEQEDAKAVQENLRENLEHQMRLEAALEQGEIEIHIRLPFNASAVLRDFSRGCLDGLKIFCQMGTQMNRNPLNLF